MSKLDKERLARLAEDAKSWPAYKKGELGANAPSRIDSNSAPALYRQVSQLREQLAAERAKISELEQSESRAWASRDELLKDRNDLLDQMRTGPLRAEEWQVRAIRAERNLKAERAKVALAGVNLEIIAEFSKESEPSSLPQDNSVLHDLCVNALAALQSSDALAEIRREVAREILELFPPRYHGGPIYKAIKAKFGVTE